MYWWVILKLFSPTSLELRISTWTKGKMCGFFPVRLMFIIKKNSFLYILMRLSSLNLLCSSRSGQRYKSFTYWASSLWHQWAFNKIKSAFVLTRPIKYYWPRLISDLEQGQLPFLVKEHIGNILGFTGLVVSAITAELAPPVQQESQIRRQMSTAGR